MDTTKTNAAASAADEYLRILNEIDRDARILKATQLGPVKRAMRKAIGALYYGGGVLIERNAKGHEKAWIVTPAEEIPLAALRRLIEINALEPAGDALFSGDTQTYRLTFSSSEGGRS